MIRPKSQTAGAVILLPALCALLFLAGGCGGGSQRAARTIALTQPAPRASLFQPNFVNEVDPQSGRPNALFHWDHWPLRVYFDNAELTSGRTRLARSGFDWWTAATDGRMQYEIVNDSSAADVTVTFEKAGQTGFSGTTQHHVTDAGALVRADITINMSYLSDPANLPAAAAHEFGHALGIDGHSNTSADLMSVSPTIFQMTGPSERDLNTLRSAYPGLFAPGAQRGIAGHVKTDRTFAERPEAGGGSTAVAHRLSPAAYGA